MFLAIIVFILILSFLIFVHEFGHFIFAKATGVKVEEFCIGFPPRLWKKKKGETLYSIGLIPFGGFNKIYGEIDTGKIKDPKSFSNKPIRIRALITVGGVAMNVLLAVIIFYFLLGFSGFQSYQSLIFDYQFPFGRQENVVIIGDVAQSSPAEEQGIKTGDIIIEADGIEFENSKEFVGFIKEKQGKEVNLYLENFSTKERKNVSIIPRLEPPEKEGPLGIALGNVAKISYPTVLEKSSVGFLHSFNILHYSFFGLGHIIKISFQERALEPLKSSVAGPVGILHFTELTIDAGIVAVISLLAIISLALALFNILPIPALDGGKLVFLGIEAIIKKPVPPKIEEKITIFFFLLLILLMIAVTINDIQRFF
ncbi:site-2 protease family protein [Candidatus Parcubacteria bacterium]|nr:site-2 protease family protein [Candidatus Parcubacteria bacterium]